MSCSSARPFKTRGQMRGKHTPEGRLRGGFDPAGVTFDIDFSGDRPCIPVISAADAKGRFLVHPPATKRVKLIRVRGKT
jgi:hypothetical protein